MPKLVFLWTDIVIFVMVLCLALYCVYVVRDHQRRATWTKVFRDAPALCAAVVLALFFVVTLLDSMHFRRVLPPAAGASAAQAAAYSTKTESLLDVLLQEQISMRETTYSVPFAYQGFTKDTVEVNGKSVRDFTRLQFAGAHLKNPADDWTGDLLGKTFKGLLGGSVAFVLIAGCIAWLLSRRLKTSIKSALSDISNNNTDLPLRAALITIAVICAIGGPVVALMDYYHVLGTDRTGNDVFFQALKSVRTAFVIGTLSTIATLPFAIVLGVMSGYFKGWVDDLIQYIYTTLSSVPNVLLIAACVLMVQVFMDKNPDMFETGVERSDLRMLLLCVILGVTGWATLCRLVRAETLKLRELDYVQAATAFGLSHTRIMAQHILPNVMHLVLITTVLSFSELVLYEAVLSYVGVGVDPSQNSFGGMINLARNEMSRDPVVWWSFAAAFTFMVTLVLAANLFADGVRDAFDPRSRVFRPRLAKLVVTK